MPFGPGVQPGDAQYVLTPFASKVCHNLSISKHNCDRTIKINHMPHVLLLRFPPSWQALQEGTPYLATISAEFKRSMESQDGADGEHAEELKAQIPRRRRWIRVPHGRNGPDLCCRRQGAVVRQCGAGNVVLSRSHVSVILAVIECEFSVQIFAHGHGHGPRRAA